VLMHRGLPQARAFTAKAACCSACFLFTFLPAIASAGTYSGGSGTEAEPFRISAVPDWQELMASPADWASHFVLTADIDLNDVTITPVGNSANQFTGVFDGNDCVIRNADVNMPGVSGVSLFGYLASNGQIKNLGVEDTLIIGKSSVGGLAAGNSGTISNCYSSGSVSGTSTVGGLAGFNDGAISNCYSTGDVNGVRSVGGLVGYNEGGLSSCYSTSDVNGVEWAGDLVGTNSYGGIVHCYATGDVNTAGDCAGGLIGRTNSGSVANCYATGNIKGKNYVGGLIGYNTRSWDSSPIPTVDNSYAAGSVSGTGSYLGGLVGRNYGGTIRYCYFLDPADGGGPDNGYGTPLNDTQMKQNKSFMGFDFWGEISDGTHEIWFMPMDGGYPLLSVFEGFLPHTLQGSGTFENPYMIVDVWDLGAVQYNSGACYDIINDINLAGTTWYVAPVPEFGGILDGKSHKISNLNVIGYDYLGLFGKIEDPCTSVTDLGVEDVNIVGSSYLGGLVGDNQGGTISRCYARGCVTGADYSSCVGGLVGQNYEGRVIGCYADSSVVGGSNTPRLGGLIGYSCYGEIRDCYATGSVTGDRVLGGLVGSSVSYVYNCYATTDVTGEGNVGGLLGGNGSIYESKRIVGTVRNCYARGSVHGIGDAERLGGLVGANSGVIVDCCVTSPVTGGQHSAYIGGLAGWNEGQISGCYSTGSVAGDYDSEQIGGLVGYNNGIIRNSYATGPVSAGNSSSDLGGLVGQNGEIIEICYATGFVKGGSYNTEHLGGLCGYNLRDITNCYFLDPNDGGGPINGHGTALTYNQMREQRNFVGFDFLGEAACGTHESWVMPSEGGYPVLGFFAGIRPHELTGSGTLTDPYLIIDANDLGAVAHRPEACYQLVCDINLAGTVWSVAPIPEFAGVFDGRSHTISNVTVKTHIGSGLAKVGYGYGGIFGRIIDPRSMVANLCLQSVDITGFPAGGLAGCNYGIISNCSVSGNVTGGDELGGLVGNNYYGGIISNCCASGSVTGTGDYLGGLAGWNFSTINCCYAADKVTGDSCLGGLVGQNYEGSISNCYATGNVTGSAYCGGFVGFNGSTAGSVAYITNSYSTGPVKGSALVGGFCGRSNGGRIYNGYFLNTGGTDNREGDPLTETEMKRQNSFDGWDFIGEGVNGANDVWTIDEGEDYPRFVWEVVRGFAGDEVDFGDYCLLAEYWRREDCESSDDCSGVDIDFSGAIDFTDLRAVAERWLSGAE